MPPSKGFREMEALSGGEKAIAALAFLFAFNSYRPSPFLLLDEVDDALDAANVSAAARYVASRSSGVLYAEAVKQQRIHTQSEDSIDTIPGSAETPAVSQEVCFYLFILFMYFIIVISLQSVYPLQCIVISLKGQFFEWADGLVGVSLNSDLESSQINTLDLRQFSA